ncbi:flagellar biosynthesis anti-sigma factor FlgM [Treponema sp. OMZ 791]|uniref:flagellar biosynthesis anti-sigma factor FlgM n=1 Tax=unclassified Treponema TaxID=2638727 RepID=UPI00220E3CDC|nr:flagellar biosynthesis anti-sigma factor FlgM [Treponema sp. OMZ 789]UTC71241.1 flagellar biosynthesis anti-sigma factor FlgM [Treponema sp. OMZ 790]UTC73958.1 flagellar biosynthesis anti-sigma factor FlgM [Treponema sp. OMZ 791]
MIEKLGGVDPIKNLQNTQKPRRMEKVGASDSIQVSPEAQKLSEIYFAMDAAKAAPDVRREKIEEVTRKFQDPSYIDRVLDQTADKILNSLGF